jgi:hypothetical protein
MMRGEIRMWALGVNVDDSEHSTNNPNLKGRKISATIPGSAVADTHHAQADSDEAGE